MLQKTFQINAVDLNFLFIKESRKNIKYEAAQPVSFKIQNSYLNINNISFNFN